MTKTFRFLAAVLTALVVLPAAAHAQTTVSGGVAAPDSLTNDCQSSRSNS